MRPSQCKYTGDIGNPFPYTAVIIVYYNILNVKPFMLIHNLDRHEDEEREALYRRIKAADYNKYVRS
jgi:hypothetical protein